MRPSGYSPAFDFASKNYSWGRLETQRMERERLVLLKTKIEREWPSLALTPGSLLLVSHGSATSSMTCLLTGEKDRWSVVGEE